MVPQVITSNLSKLIRPDWRPTLLASSVGPRTGSPPPVPTVLRRKSAISIYHLRSGHRAREVMFGLISSLALARTLMSASLAKWLPLGPSRSESNFLDFSFNEFRACFAASDTRTPRFTSALVLEYVPHTANHCYPTVGCLGSD